jgi:hypothetical protein
VDGTTAYREPAEAAPLRVWRVRMRLSSRVVRAIGWLLVWIGVLTVAVAALGSGGFRWTLLFYAAVAALPGLLVLMAHGAVGAADAVAGGAGEIRLFEDRLEVPRAQRDEHGRVDVFRLDDLEIELSELAMSFNLVFTAVVQVAELRSGSARRRVSSRLFESDEAFAEFVDTVDHVRHRLPVAATGSDEYDERLDRELDALD